MNSRAKGKRGERAVVSFLCDRGFKAERAQQYKGGQHSADVFCPDFPFHIEVKAVERMAMRDWVAQAEADAGSTPWAIFHRWNHGPLLVTLRAEELLKLL